MPALLLSAFVQTCPSYFRRAEEEDNIVLSNIRFVHACCQLGEVKSVRSAPFQD